jgi:isoquinoline 1-oxidoreductase beta subunit
LRDDSAADSDRTSRSGARAGRRTFLKSIAAAGGSLLLAARWPALAAGRREGNGAVGSWVTAWVRIAPDNTVTLILSQAEMGQGISTTLPALLADELGADWEAVRLETAPFDPAYRNPKRSWMFTGNSESTQAFHDHIRKMGAAAREMLTQAAAARWAIAASRCRTEASHVISDDGRRRVAFGEIAADAAGIAAPAEPKLKDDRELKLIGRAVPRVDVPSKVDGSAQFGIDVKVPGMLLAAVRSAPGAGGRLIGYDREVALSRPGVKAVVPLPDGVAVVADTWWRARSALLAMKPAFDAGDGAAMDHAAIMKRYADALENGPFAAAAAEGDALAAIRGAGSRAVTQEYQSPFEAHATMEPMNCTAHVTADRCEIWAPTQGQELALYALKGALGLRDDQIAVNRSDYLGGGFGRRLLPDFVVQAALVSKAAGAPVKVIWDREEDIRRDHYRPATRVRLTAAVDEGGQPYALAARVVSPTILLPVFPTIKPVLDKTGVDPSCMEGMAEVPYRLKHRRVDFHLLQTPIRTSVMRTTGYGPNIFALESFIDELAAAARADPVAYRRALLAHDPRALAVLERAATLARWGTPLESGQGRGIAFSLAFGSYLAQVVEVGVAGDAVRVVRVVTVVDCGRVLDPGIAAAGIEGGTIFGLAYCKARITFRAGAAVEDNFDRYTLPYLAESPDMVTEFIDGGGELGGIGELSPVTVPPALANAIFSATGRRVRSMPLSEHGLQLAPNA